MNARDYAPDDEAFPLPSIGARLDDLQRRQREQFAEEYARMEAATANDPHREDEDCTDLG